MYFYTIYTEQYVTDLHSDELRSLEFPRIPSATRPEYFTIILIYTLYKCNKIMTTTTNTIVLMYKPLPIELVFHIFTIRQSVYSTQWRINATHITR
jgi:hypothetical protein